MDVQNNIFDFQRPLLFNGEESDNYMVVESEELETSRKK